MKINLKRAALSLGIIGAILLPIRTGSLKYFLINKEMTTDIYEYDEVEIQKKVKFYKDNRLDENDCFVFTNFKDNMDARTKELCAEADRFKVRKNTTKVISNEFGQFLRDTALGFLIPSLIVLVGPRLGKSYVNWLTH